MSKIYYAYTDYVSYKGGVTNLQVCKITNQGLIVKTFTSKVNKAVSAAKKWSNKNIKTGIVDYSNCN